MPPTPASTFNRARAHSSNPIHINLCELVAITTSTDEGRVRNARLIEGMKTIITLI